MKLDRHDLALLGKLKLNRFTFMKTSSQETRLSTWSKADCSRENSSCTRWAPELGRLNSAGRTRRRRLGSMRKRQQAVRILLQRLFRQTDDCASRPSPRIDADMKENNYE
jgi:hypothetical protein